MPWALHRSDPVRERAEGRERDPGMGIREIAVALKVPTGTVKSRLFHARQQLKACLTRQRRTP